MKMIITRCLYDTEILPIKKVTLSIKRGDQGHLVL